MVNVYDESGEVIVGQVKSNTNLDFWDGSNHTSGSPGRHKGLTRLSDGRYVLIHGTQWQGEHDTAEVISEDQAVQEILRSGNTELFEEFSELEELRDRAILKEA